jgi:membrane-associated progesterone receptor component
MGVLANALMENFGYIVILVSMYLGYCFVNMTSQKQPAATISTDTTTTSEAKEEDDETEPPRNFTQKQLLEFNGTRDERLDQDKPVYLSVNGIVFDVSEGRDFYGPGGPYELFAGHECGVALAKMSFDTEFLDDLEGCKNLNYGEKEELENWINKFQHWRNYPVMGRLIPDDKMPDPNRILTIDDLWKNNGEGEVPEGYATAPIYIGAHDKVYDMSFGGVIYYGKGCSYNVFAGRNAARALATMSLKEEDAKNPDISDLDEKKIKVLNDWKKTFEERKSYPIVGRLEV